jgi:2-dehydropantoate 2-reductase
MKIAVYGSGGVGGYFGGLLARTGHDVTFIARGEHLNAMQESGLQVISANGDFTLPEVKATNNPAELGPVDYVIVGLKHYHLPQAAPQIKPLVGTNTTVVPLLNGVDAHEYLIEALGPKPVVGGLCSLVSMVASPGVIQQPSKLTRVVVGELDRTKSERVEKIITAWDEAGAEAIHAQDIYVAMWTKFLFIASFGGVSSLANATIGEIRSCAETRQLLTEAMAEIEALARAQDIQLADDVVESALALTDGFEASATSSMQRDVITGKPFELEAFSGTITRSGEEFGVPTPIHRTIYGLLKPALDRA